MARALPVKQLASGIDTRLSPQIMTGRGNSMVLPKTLAIYVFVAQLEQSPWLRIKRLKVRILPETPYYAPVAQLEEVLDLDSRGCQFESDQGYHFYKEFIMNFIRYEKTQLVIGDSDPKKLQNMVDGYRHKGYNVSNDLNQMFNRYKTSRPVYYKIISL